MSFRLSILAQILVALQDLSIRATSELSKSSKPELILDEKQNEWINESTKKAFLLVSQHPNGRVHFRFLRHVIRSERNWVIRINYFIHCFYLRSNGKHYLVLILKTEPVSIYSRLSISLRLRFLLLSSLGTMNWGGFGATIRPQFVTGIILFLLSDITYF